jgi:DNA-binding MarR family transcriptional regulator
MPAAVVKPASSRNGSPKVAPAFRALLRTIGLLKRAMEPYFARHGISASQWAVLRTLHRARDDGADGVRLTDLSDDLLIRPPSVTGAVDRLQRMGLVQRSLSQADHRERRVSLTLSGQRLVERVQRGHAGRVQQVLGALNISEQNQLQRLLDRLADHLEALIGQQNDRFANTNHEERFRAVKNRAERRP